MNENDYIKKLFQSKLSNFEAEVPPDGWAKLEKALYPPTDKRIIPLYWYAAAAVAVILIVGGLFVFQWQQDGVQPDNISQNHPMDNLGVGKVFTQQVKTTLPRDKKLSNKNVDLLTRKNKNNNARVRISEFLRDKNTNTNNVLFSERISANVNQIDIAIDKKNDVEIKNPLREEQYDLLDGNKHSEPSEGGESLFKRDKQEISLAMNSNSSMMSYTQNGTQQISLRSAKSEDGSKMLSQNSDAQENEPRKAQLAHNQPISLGLMLSKKISEKVSVEAGVMYTHLISKSLNYSSNSDNQQRQSIHYIGIPLNVNYKFASWNNLDLYLSLGGAVQKDVYGRFSYRERTNNLENESASLKKVTLKIKQKNPQFSVNGGLGITYPIYNDLKLYGKFGTAYYFDAKNEYKTIYSDQKLIFDINIGLKIDF